MAYDEWSRDQRRHMTRSVPGGGLLSTVSSLFCFCHVNYGLSMQMRSLGVQCWLLVLLSNCRM